MTPTLSMFGRYGVRNLTTDDQPNIPLPSGGAGNGHIYARNRQLVLGTTWTPSGRSLFEARFGYSWTQAGKNPPALGSSSAFDQFGLAGLPADERITGGLPTQLITGYADLGRQATNPQWQYPTVYNPKINYTWMTGAHSFKTGYEYQHIDTEVQDVNPLYGRDTYNSSFTRPAGAGASNLFNLADFMLGLRAQYALSSVLVANLRRNMHFAYVQDDWRANNRLTLNLGIRYEYSTPYWERDNILTNFDPDRLTMVHATDGSISDRALVNPDRNNFGPRLGFAYTFKSPHRHPRRLRYQLRALQPRRWRRFAADQRAAGGQRGRQPDGADRADIRAGRAGLSHRARGSVAVQSADREHHLHPERLPLQPGAELVHLLPARDHQATC